MQNKHENDIIRKRLVTKTKDFSQAVTLLSLGYTLLELERGNGKFVVFVFEIDPVLVSEIWDRYWLRDVQVDARTMLDKIHELKTRIHSGEGRL